MSRVPFSAAMPLLAGLFGASMVASLATNVAADEATPAIAAAIAVADPFPAHIPTAGMTIGAPDAPVDVVVWADYTCPGCGRFAREIFPLIVADVVAPGEARTTFRDYAFRGPEALRAAEAAACAADQLAFWPYHQTLFLNQDGPGSFGEDRLLAMARALALDVDAFAECLRSGAKQDVVARSNAADQERGIDSVPTLFVNGLEVTTWHDASLLGAEIERALVAAATSPPPAATEATKPPLEPAAPVPLVGVELVFAARPPDGVPLGPAAALAIRDALERRIAALGLTGGIWRRPGDQILVRIDATDDPARVVHALATPALLEIIDPRGTFLAPGTTVATTLSPPESGVDDMASPVATDAHSGDAAPTGGPVYETIVSGADLRDAYVTTGGDGVTLAIGFELHADAASRLYDYTRAHVGQPMSIVIDKRVISSPTVRGAISGRGIIEGLPPAEVHDLVAQLESGALATPLELVESRNIAVPAIAGTPAP